VFSCAAQLNHDPLLCCFVQESDYPDDLAGSVDRFVMELSAIPSVVASNLLA
jgi:hypothetical protein